MAVTVPEDIRQKLSHYIPAKWDSEEFIREQIEPFLEALPAVPREGTPAALEQFKVLKRRGDRRLASERMANIRFNLREALVKLVPETVVSIGSVILSPELLDITLAGIGTLIAAVVAFAEGRTIELSDDESRIVLAVFAHSRKDGTSPSVDALGVELANLMPVDRVEALVERLRGLGLVRTSRSVVDGKPTKIVTLNDTIVYEDIADIDSTLRPG